MTTTRKTTKEIAQDIRNELKTQFPACKFSVTSDYNSITVALMSAPETPFVEITKGYEQLNHYYLDNYLLENDQNRPASYGKGIHLTPKAVKMFKKISKFSNKENWNHSDYMADYFDVNYYFNLHIGKWNKEFSIC